MKRTLLALAFVFVASFLWVGVAQAAVFRSGDTASVDQEETVDSSVYVAGSTVRVAGTVRGDVYCAGQMIEITGTVEGDVLCAGQTVRVAGTVSGDVRVAGQTVTLGGTVHGSATIVGQTTSVDSDALINRDLTAFGQSLQVAGNIGRDLVSGAEQFTLAAEVGRDVEASGTTVSVLRTTRVGGNLVYTSDQNAQLEQGATITGQTQRKDPPANQKNDATDRFLLSAFWFGALLLIGLAALLVAPRGFGLAVQTLQQRPLATLGLGFAGLFLTPIVAVLLMMTVIGMPLGFLLLALWLISMPVALVVAAYCTGMLVANKLNWNRLQQIVALLVGVLLLVIVGIIPYVGGIVVFISLLWGLGSLLLAAVQNGRWQAEAKHSKPTAKSKAKPVA